MMFTTHAPAPAAPPPMTTDSAWLEWRTDGPAEPERLTVAELSECCCPDLCDRDHGND